MSQTPEIRIRLQFKAMKRRLDWSYFDLSSLYLRLGRQWRRPVREIKAIIRGEA